jgi:4-hydroxybenzoate polyprenyltransferase
MAWLTVLGIPAVVYVVSITALMFHMHEKPQNPLLLFGVGLLTAGIYTLHRTSIIAVEPMQSRHRIVLRHKKLLLFVSFCLLVLAAGTLALHTTIATLFVLASIAGVSVYGKKIMLKPLRNVLYVKPLAVGVAIATFAWALNDFSNALWTLVSFILICSADALICDLADCDYDLASGCETLASKFGPRITWRIAALLYICAGFILHSTVGWVFLALFPLPLFWPNRLRTAVDLRPFLVLLLAWSL